MTILPSNVQTLLDKATKNEIRLKRTLSRTQNKLDFLVPELDPVDYEEIFCLSAKMLHIAKHLLETCYSFQTNSTPPYDFIDLDNALNVDAVFETPNILCCTLPTMPITKGRTAAHAYTNLYNEPLRRMILQNYPENFQLFPEAYVIYAHYHPSHITPYYDNDNLAIKSLLDTVIPLICPDDAACFCDNLYFSVPSEQQKTKLWVVEKGYLSNWASLHPEMPILKEFKI